MAQIQIKLFPREHFSFDKFNNLVLFSDENIEEAYNYCVHEQSLKTAAILLYGCPKKSLSYQRVYVGKIKDEFIIVGDQKVLKDTQVHIFVIPNKTLIPQTILVNDEPTIQSGLTLALFVGKNQQIYFICVHDPTKPVLSLPGGTMAEEDGGIRIKTAKRKFNADTGISETSLENMQSFCEMSFHNSVFGISHVPDVAEFFTTFIRNPFSESEFNEKEGCYVRKINTLKADLMLGLPLKLCTAHSMNDLTKESLLSTKQWQNNKLSRILNFVLFGYSQNLNQTFSSQDIAHLEMLFTPQFTFKTIKK